MNNMKLADLPERGSGRKNYPNASNKQGESGMLRSMRRCKVVGIELLSILLIANQPPALTDSKMRL